jgi:uncharacterized protein YbbK (DUF523 family)
MKKEVLLISACLLGVACRYDGKSVQKITKEQIDSLRERYELVPICPEIYGGLTTPRNPSEQRGGGVFMNNGRDVSAEFLRGAQATLMLARTFEAKKALLKARSPSCGKGAVYDGSFTGKLINSDGVTAELLMKNGISVFNEQEISKL